MTDAQVIASITEKMLRSKTYIVEGEQVAIHEALRYHQSEFVKEINTDQGRQLHKKMLAKLEADMSSAMTFAQILLANAKANNPENKIAPVRLT